RSPSNVAALSTAWPRCRPRKSARRVHIWDKKQKAQPKLRSLYYECRAVLSRGHRRVIHPFRSLLPGLQQAQHHLPEDGQRTYDEYDVAEGTYPAQGLQQRLLHELFAARIPHAFSNTGVELDKPDRQQAGGDHQHQTGVQTPESGTHDFVVE